jgi:hypothetical protein
MTAGTSGLFIREDKAKLSAIYGGWDDTKERIVAEWLNS